MAHIEGCKHEIEIVIPAAEVAKEADRIAEGIRGKVQLQGFRPGKAPLSMIRKMYADRIRQEVLDSLLPKFFTQKAREEKYEVVGTPSVTHVEFNDGQPITFKAEFEVVPEFELKDYRGLPVTYAEPTIPESDVEENLEQLRKSKAEYINLDPRPAEAGDVVLVDLHSVGGLEGEPIHGHDTQIELGSPDTLAAFNEHIPGMSPGDEKIISATYPEDYGNERLAGKTLQFKIELKMLQRKELPELNDDFAKDMGDFQSFEELKNTVRTNLLRSREAQAQRAAKDALADNLGEAYEFAVPEAFIDRQVESYVNRYMSAQAALGRDPNKTKVDFAKVKEASRDRAIKEVRTSLVLDRVAEREGIGATQEEVDRELQRHAKERREPVAAVRKRWNEDGTMNRVAHAIRTEKTLNFLFENAHKELPASA